MKLSDRTFRLFVSSTFADFITERDALWTSVFPKVERLCAKLGARFEAVDMRWGVSTDQVRAQDTMQVCLREMRRCVETGIEPNLLILLGDRYGSQLLPDEIAPTVFEHIVECVAIRRGSRAENTLRQHYPLDMNAEEPVHRLDAVHAAAGKEGELREYLDMGTASLPRAVHAQLNASATEREIEAGLRGAASGSRRALCCIRTFVGRSELGAPWIDTDTEGGPNPASARRVQQLKKRLRTRLGKRVINLRAKLVNDELDSGYIDRFIRIVLKNLCNDIRAQAAGWQTESVLDREIAAHQRFAADRAGCFVGRKESLERIAAYLSRWQGRAFVIGGESGIGKSALLGAAVRDFRKRRPKVPVVIRFIGATPRSLRGETLLSDLNIDIQRFASGGRQKTKKRPSSIIAELKETLARVRRPLVLVIDGLNQISGTDPARDLRWLPLKIPKNVWLIVSAVSGSFAFRQIGRKYPDCNEIRLTGLKFEEGQNLLENWLKEKHRRLQPNQHRAILRSFAKQRSPLQLRLAANEAARLRSTEPVYHPGETVESIMGAFIDRLARRRQHGALFVARSLAYIAASRYGLSQSEIRRVLWNDPEVRKEYRRRHPHAPQGLNTVAPLIWVQLYHELSPYLTLRESQDQELVTFFHDQVRKVVERRYLTQESSRRHGMLARSFTPPKGENYSRRAFAELSRQLCSADQWRRTSMLFKDAAFIAGSLKELGIETLVEDIDFALERGRGHLPDRDHIEGLRRALAQSSHALQQRRGEITTQLLGRLQDQNRAATRKLRRDLTRNEKGAWLLPLGESLSTRGLMRVLDLHVFDSGESLRLSAYEEDHQPRVWDLHVCRDQRTILTALHDGTLRAWDAVTGRLVAVLSGHDGEVESVCATPDGSYAISAGNDGKVIIWDLLRFEPVKKLNSPKAETSVAALPSGDGFVSGSVDGRVRMWKIHGGRKPRTLGKGHKDSIWRLTVSRAGTIAISSSQDGTIVLWDLRTGKHRLLVRTNHMGDLFRAVQLTADDRYCVSATGGGDVVTTRISDGKSTWHHVHNAVIRDLALTKQERSVVTVCRNGQLAVSGIQSGRILHRIQAHGDEVNTVDLGSDGKSLFTGASDGVVKVWDLPGIRASRSLPTHCMRLVGIDVVRSGKRIISADEAGEVHEWDARSGRHLARIPLGKIRLRSFCATSDGRTAAYITSPPIGGNPAGAHSFDSSTCHVRDLRSNQDRSFNTGIPGRESYLTITKNDKYILLATEEEDITIFSLESMIPIRKLNKSGYYVEQILVTADSKRVVVTSWKSEDFDRKRILVYNFATGKRERVLVANANNIRCAVLRGQTQVLAASADGKIRIWDLRTGKMAKMFQAHSGGIRDLAITRNGRRIVTAGEDGLLKRWDLRRRSQRTIAGHSGIERLALSPSGRLCACSSADWLLHVWDMKRCKLLAVFTANDAITPFRVLPDERTIIAVESTGSLHFLRLEGGTLKSVTRDTMQGHNEQPLKTW